MRHPLFVPALLIPGITLLDTPLLRSAVIGGHPLVDPNQATLISLGLGAVAALVANLNVVPAALVQLPDRNGVIRVQAPTALILLLGISCSCVPWPFRDDAARP